MNVHASPAALALTLDELALGSRARITGISWALLGSSEAARLRQFGFAEEVMVEPLHAGLFGRDPLAVRVGRMTVALRRAQARAIRVVPIAV